MYTAQELKEALGREALSNLGRAPEAVVADKGCQSAEMLEAMEAEELNAHVAQPKVQTTQGYGHEAFAYDAERDEYFCPGGARLTFWKTKRLRQTLYRVYRSSRTRPGSLRQPRPNDSFRRSAGPPAGHSLQPNDFRDRLALAGSGGSRRRFARHFSLLTAVPPSTPPPSPSRSPIATAAGSTPSP
jgi:hypothetical protein